MSQRITKDRLKEVLNILIWIALGGFLLWALQSCTAKKSVKADQNDAAWNQRIAANEALINAGPTTKASQTPEGTVIELSIPSSSMGGLSVAHKRCIIWQDRAFPSVAMSCESEPRPQIEPMEKPDNTPPYNF